MTDHMLPTRIFQNNLCSIHNICREQIQSGGAREKFSVIEIKNSIAGYNFDTKLFFGLTSTEMKTATNIEESQ